MNSTLKKIIMLLCYIHLIFTSVHGQEDIFHLKANGKDKSFLESCKSVELHYKRKVVCESSKDNYIGNYLVPLDINSISFWQAVCELSKQSEYGFSTFFNGVMFSNDAFHVLDYKIYKNHPVVIKGPMYYEKPDGKKKAVMEIFFYNNLNHFDFPEFHNICLVSNGTTAVLKKIRVSRGNNLSKWYAIPKGFAAKNTDVSFYLKSNALVNFQKYNITAKTGAVLSKNGVTLMIIDVSKANGFIKVKYKLDWVSGLSVSEMSRENKIMLNYKKSYKVSLSNRKWLTSLEKRTNIKRCKVFSVNLIGKDGVEHKSKSSSNIFGVSSIVEGECEFKINTMPLKLVFNVCEKKYINKKFIFKKIDLSGN